MPRTLVIVWRAEAMRLTSGMMASDEPFAETRCPKWSPKKAIACWRRSSHLPDDIDESAGRAGTAVEMSCGVRNAATARSGFASIR